MGGPKCDSVWREPDSSTSCRGLLPRKWSTPIGEGYSGPAVAEGLVYITDRQRGSRTRNGSFAWMPKPARKSGSTSTRSATRSSYPAGPRATPVVDAGRVYTIGAQGDMFCFDASDGKVLWQKNFENDYQTKLPTWGMAAAPMVDGDQLITLVGGAKGALVVSFDKATGKELWRALNDPAGRLRAAANLHVRQDAAAHHLASRRRHRRSTRPTAKSTWDVPFKVKHGAHAFPRRSRPATGCSSRRSTMAR